MRQGLPEEIQVFRDGRPEVGEYPAQARELAMASLADAASSPGTAGRSGRVGRGWGWTAGRSGRGPWPRLGLVGGVAAGVAVAVTLAVLPSQPGGPGEVGGTRPGGAHASAAEVLTLAAMTAARQTPPALVVSRFIFISQIFNKGGTGQRCDTVNASESMYPDGAGSATQAPVAKGCGGSVTQSWRKGGIPRNTPPDSWPVSLYAWQGLPDNPAALEGAIVQRYEHGHPLASATFMYASDLLGLTAPPALRSALFKVIELLPGVQNLGPATDREGRHGIAVGLVVGGVRSELIFNQANAFALEYELVAVAPKQNGNNDDPPGTLFGYTVYLSSGAVISSLTHGSRQSTGR